LLCVLTTVAVLAGATRAGEREEQERLKGSWTLVESGLLSQPNKGVNQQMSIAGTKITFGPGSEYVLHLAPTREPREFDLRPLNSKDDKSWYKGIYMMQGDMLTMVYATPGGARPANFRDATQNGAQVYVMKYQRVQGGKR
jgi:uncharacterized protein (TIGR03067 family)